MMGVRTRIRDRQMHEQLKVGCEPKPEKSINHHSKTEFLEDVENAVGEEKINSLGRQRLSSIFSLSEFENITALNCAPFVEDEDFTETKVHKGLWKMLKVQRKSPCKRELKGALEDVYSWSTEDKIRFTYLSILATVILGEDDKKELPLKLSRMVFDLPKFEKYPWGREAFKRLIASVKHGFVQTLQVWAYNIIPSLRTKIGRPSNIDGPPILKFKGLKGTNNIDINLVSVADTDNIMNVVINHVTPIVSDDKVVDNKIDALLQAICKKGGMGLVTWVEHGTKNIQMEKNTGEEVRGETEEENEKSDDKETSRKRKIKVRIDSTKKLKAPESCVSVGSTEHTEALQMKAKLKQKAKKVETLESKIEEMGKQLQSFETMKLRVGLLENEFMLLKEKSKTNEAFIIILSGAF
ncbi:hypothetical protein BRARA_I02413 [Brassica rapa]|uniref:DUF1985 domain-containing protein n=2 Tax=Brassica campestris TaxID=3711 RepID=A0A397XWI0_BRACM|nr:hypothetical protein BRARA_I02413 [Brassica rapa]